MKRLLIISGFEANGFAGLLSDVHLATTLGLTPSAVVTTLTAQSPTQLLAAQAVDSAIIDQQLRNLAEPPQVIKIGLLPNRAVAKTIANWLQDTYENNRPVIVLDPVASSSGDLQSLVRAPLVEIVSPLLKWVTLLCPNWDELIQLAGDPDGTVDEATMVTRFYQSNIQFNGDILLTGGHSIPTCDNQPITDNLYRPLNGNMIRFASWSQHRFDFLVRGTGCFLSTAIASALCEGYAMLDAVTLANAHLHQHYQASSGCYRLHPKTSSPNHPWPNDINFFPKINQEPTAFTNKTRREFPQLKHKLGLYPIVDSAVWVKRLAQLGIKTIQLRIKNKSDSVLREEIKTAVQFSKVYNLQLFINDYWSLAIEYGAYGVHLGQEDLSTADLAKIHSAGLHVGISTHGDFEFLLGRQFKPSYLAVGAIFPTKTKDMSGKIQGIKRLKRFCEIEKNIPIVAIGGINGLNIYEVLNVGASMVAVVSAITQSECPERSTQLLLDACDAYQKEYSDYV